MKPLFSWYGGKQMLADWIVPLLPPHEVYIEPFGGAAAVLLAKPPCKFEVYNDLHSGVVNFYRVLRDEEKTNQLIKLLENTPYSREEFYSCRSIVFRGPQSEADLNHAWAFFVNARQSFGGDHAKKNGGSWGYTLSDSREINAFNAAITQIKSVANRFKSVQIENKDALAVIRNYDQPGALIYCDPPYHDETCDAGYKHKTDHAELIKLLLSVRANVVLSGFQHESYNILLDAGWERHEYSNKPINATNNKGGNREYKTECLWIKPYDKGQLELF